MVELVQPGGTGIEGVSLPEARRAGTAVQDHLSGSSGGLGMRMGASVWPREGRNDYRPAHWARILRASSLAKVWNVRR